MKVLLISDHAAPIGGSEIALLALRDGLRQRGHEVRLFASSALLEDAQTADDLCFGTTSRWRTLLRSANPWAARRLQQVLAEFRPDIAHVQIFVTQLSPLIMPLLRNIPVLYYAVWYGAVCPLGTKTLPNGTPCSFAAGRSCYQQGCLPLRDWPPLMAQMALLRRWRDSFDLVVANGTAVQQALLQAGIAPVEIIEHSVNAWNASDIARAPFPLIVFAGRLVPEKGADVLIDAFAQIVKQFSDAQLLITGEGPQRDTLRAQIISHDLIDQVTLAGHLSQEEMNHRFEPAWVQVIPSRWIEPFGNVAVEAMFRGTPVIASATGGLAGIVNEGETGLLVAPNDENALAAALLKLLSDPRLRERMSVRGREIALSRYSTAMFVENMLAAYHSVLETS